MNRKTNADLFREAQRYIPGGVNSPVRAFYGMGVEPVFIERAEGARIYGADGKAYIDYVGSWGPMICGHAHPDVVRAVQQAASAGLSFGAPTRMETRMAERLCDLMPSLEQVRMVNSGTEACMSAIRLARGFTGRDRILKFEGCYHGHSDALLVKAGSGALTLGVPSSPGVPESVTAHTLNLPFNDLEAVASAFSEHGDSIACVIVEPVTGNMSCVPPMAGFLEGLRELCDRHGSVLIFDEVMTGFRVALGGAQALYGVRPDLTCLGKIVGGGLPVGAFGGRRDIMQQLAPGGPVYQAGTLSGNPLGMAAGLATLELVSAPGFYEKLTRRTQALVRGIAEASASADIAVSTNAVGGMFGLFFTGDAVVRSYREVQLCDGDRFRAFFAGMLEHGVYFAPSPFEAGFVSSAHTERLIEETVMAAENVFAAMR